MKAAFPDESLRNPRIFRFHRAVAETEDEGQSEERRESDEAAKLENEKRDATIPKTTMIRAG